MRSSIPLAAALALVACSKPAAAPAELCHGVAATGVHPGQPVTDSDARSIASLHCESTDPANDFVGDLEQTSYESATFALTLRRTRPSAIDRTDCVTALFSGHVYRFTNAAVTMGMQGNPDPAPGVVGWLNSAFISDGPNGPDTLLVDGSALRCWGVRNESR